MADGMVSNYIVDIIQDKQGYMDGLRIRTM